MLPMTLLWASRLKWFKLKIVYATVRSKKHILFVVVTCTDALFPFYNILMNKAGRFV